MHRIATAPPPVEIAQPVITRSPGLLTLLLVLEALRQAPLSLDRAKV